VRPAAVVGWGELTRSLIRATLYGDRRQSSDLEFVPSATQETTMIIFSMAPLGGHQIYVEARVAAGSDKTGVRPVNTQGMNLATNLESSDAGITSNIKMTMGSWVCYEWQITGIGGAGTFTSYVDGMMIAKQNGTIPALTRQRIGFQRYMPGTAGELWIDDVAIGAARIGCL
jgi:hypothetical protein